MSTAQIEGVALALSLTSNNASKPNATEPVTLTFPVLRETKSTFILPSRHNIAPDKLAAYLAAFPHLSEEAYSTSAGDGRWYPKNRLTSAYRLADGSYRLTFRAGAAPSHAGLTIPAQEPVATATPAATPPQVSVPHPTIKLGKDKK